MQVNYDNSFSVQGSERHQSLSCFSVTFETITEESAEHGEPESAGFEAENVTLREALDIIGGCEGGVEADEWPVRNPRWFTFYKQNEDYSTGEVTNMSLHLPDSLTKSSRLRIARLIGCQGLRRIAA